MNSRSLSATIKHFRCALLALSLLLLSLPVLATTGEKPSSSESFFVQLNGNSYSLTDDETLDMNHQDQGGSTSSWAFEVHDIQTRFSRRPLQIGLHGHAHDYDGVIIKAAEVTFGRQLWRLDKRNMNTAGFAFGVSFKLC